VKQAGIEAKVQASTLAAAAAGVILWVLQTYVFKGNAVPGGLVSLVDAATPALAAAIAGYLAPHTPRTPPAPAPAPVPAPPAAPAPPA